MTGCAPAYYAAMETVGKEKRHLLKDRVEDVKNDQTKAQEEFKDALTKIRELYNLDGGELETFYDRLKASYEDCEDRAETIRKRMGQVNTLATDLFAEWKVEINEIRDTKLKSASRQSLADAKIRYAKLKTAMDRSKTAMDPVLTKLNDYVLYLKHDLNAKAVGALGREVVSIEGDVDRLIRDMGASIQEADQFIKNF
jgi:DNA-nicking Smr family endonuclease